MRLGGLLLCLFSACSVYPKRRYGVDDLVLTGVERMEPEAIRACLATQPRDKVTIGLGPTWQPECGEPPFVKSRRQKRLFAWPWADYPAFDESVLKLDMARIERWYQARGYYDARVTGFHLTPVPSASGLRPPSCGRACMLDVYIDIQEGEPVRIHEVSVTGVAELPQKVRRAVYAAASLEVGDVFDESRYDAARAAMEHALREYGYARCEVRGAVAITRASRRARVDLQVIAGHPMRVGGVRVESPRPVPDAPILAAAELTRDAPFRERDLEDAQRSVYALGAFSYVSIHPDPASKDPEAVDLIIDVTPREKAAFSLGGGLMSGVLATGPTVDQSLSVPQWDVHLVFSYENRNFFGGLRQFRIEERPRLIFLGPFPKVPEGSPQFGNLLSVRFAQPGIPEARTKLYIDGSWDHGPDPFRLFFREDFRSALGLERSFLSRIITARVAFHKERMIVNKRQPLVNDPPSSYRLTYLEQWFALDLRDRAPRPTRGFYLLTSVQEALKIHEPTWNYVRIIPDARAYVPLFLGWVLAARFSVGALMVWDASPDLDPDSQKLGPQAHRLRGGGAQSNRGFLPGQLGDSKYGGIRRWESSVELRIPLSKNFEAALFGDMGDVHAGKSFRFSHLNTSLGGGLRLHTPVGPFRFDVAARPRRLQTLDGSAPSDATSTIFGQRFRGAIHLTVGDAF